MGRPECHVLDIPQARRHATDARWYRRLYAQDRAHAELARELLRHDPAVVDRLNGLDGIRITIEEEQER